VVLRRAAAAGQYRGVDPASDLPAVARVLAAAGCVAADEEAAELVAAAAGDAGVLRALVDRRVTGEPLAWITGRTVFCGLEVAVDPGVYVPRWQSEPLARRAADHLPDTGVAVDLCCGAGAIGLVLREARPGAEVVGTEVDPVAARCARRNGLSVLVGDLDDPLPELLAGRVDVLVGVLPYVPAGAMATLPRDVRDFEPRLALDGGENGLEVVARAVRRSPRWLRPGGWLLLEVGSDQVDGASALLMAAGFGDPEVIEDGDGDPRAVSARFAG